MIQIRSGGDSGMVSFLFFSTNCLSCRTDTDAGTIGSVSSHRLRDGVAIPLGRVHATETSRVIKTLSSNALTVTANPDPKRTFEYANKDGGSSTYFWSHTSYRRSR